MAFLAWFLGEIVILLSATLLILLLPEYADSVGFAAALIATGWIFVIGCLAAAIGKNNFGGNND